MKKKLKLDLDTVTVESFDTDEAARGRGTVQANSGQSSACSLQPPDTCLGGNTCWDSCGGSCDSLCHVAWSDQYWNSICV